MKTQLIILENKSLIVSDEELLNEKDFYLGYPDYNHVFQWNMGNGIHKGKSTYAKKIIAGLENQPTIDYSALSDEDCKKIGYVDVKKLANKYYGDDDYTKESKIGFIKGFKKSQSLNDKKFSLEDMKKAYYSGRGFGKLMETHNWYCFEKSLHQPKVFDIIGNLSDNKKYFIITQII